MNTALACELGRSRVVHVMTPAPSGGAVAPSD